MDQVAQRPMRIPRRCADCNREFTRHAQYIGFNFGVICRDRIGCQARAMEMIAEKKRAARGKKTAAGGAR
jgi:hypothetical protein